MKKVFSFIVSFTLFFAGCSYDDSDLWNKVDDLDSRVKEIEKVIERLNGEIETVKTLISQTAILDVTQTRTGYVITFTDGTSITINHGTDGIDGQNGTDGTDAPIIGIGKHTDGVYYWTLTVNDRKDWLLDNEGEKIPVTGHKGEDGYQGNDGVTPVMGVDSAGYWTVDYGNGPQRVLDENGFPVMAGGDGGESIFEGIDTSDENFVIFYFSNGEILVMPRTDARFSFQTVGTVYFSQQETKTLGMDIKNIRYAEVLKVPEGWSASIDIGNASATINASDENGESEGMVSFIAMDNKGNMLMAGIMVGLEIDWGYAHPDGTWLVLEGNMTSENGTLVWFDADMTMHEKIFENANDGLEIGCVVQDIYIANDRLYVVSQNGDSRGGAGRFVVCDIHTLEMEYALDLSFYTGSVLCWPQHVVVINDKKAYIAWSDSAMETTSGIRILDLETGNMAQSDIEGTYGAFTTEGALKGRMVYSRGKIFAGTGHSGVIIDTVTDTVEKKIEFGCQVKGVVKGADGNIYFALAGEYSGSSPNMPGKFLTDPKIVGIDHQGNIVHDKYLPGVVFPVGTASPKIQLCASFNEPYLYFTDKNEFYFTSIGRYNYETGTVTTEFIKTPDIYGYLGVHPSTEQLWVTASSTLDWKRTRVNIYDTQTRTEVGDWVAGRGFNGGVDFGYRFTDKFVNR